MGDLDIENMRFGIKSHLEISSIIKLPHTIILKIKFPSAGKLKYTTKEVRLDKN